jgi:hypothetical protein
MEIPVADAGINGEHVQTIPTRNFKIKTLVAIKS